MTTQEIVNEAVKAMSSVLEDKFNAFGRQFTELNTSAIDSAVKKAKRETFTCKKKGNQQQYDHCQQVLEKFDESLDHFRAGSTEKLTRSLEEGAELVEKRIKAIKLADKSDYGWATVSEYLSDALASDSDDEKRMYRAEKRAERKVKEKQREKRAKSRFSFPIRGSSSPQFGGRETGEKTPVAKNRLGPCFKISITFVFSLPVIWLGH